MNAPRSTSNGSPYTRFRRNAFAVSLLLLAAGCVSGGGRTIEQLKLPAHEPVREEILRDLGSNDQAIHTFRAAGSFLLESPKLTATQRFPRGQVLFRRPADLFVLGRHRITNQTLFKLTSVDRAYLMEFPLSREDSFYQLEGDLYADVPFSVSPSDVAREMFLPEQWLELAPSEVRIVAFKETDQTAVVEIGDPKAPRRRIEVARFNTEHPAWVVVRNTRLDESGRPIAVTELSEYQEVDRIRFPGVIEAFFPTEETRMTFSMRNIRPNYELSDADFDIAAKIAELDLDPRPPL